MGKNSTQVYVMVSHPFLKTAGYQITDANTDFGGAGLLNADSPLGTNTTALGTKRPLKEMQSNLLSRDNVNQTVASGVASIEEAEKSFHGKWEAAIELSSDNTVIDRFGRVVENVVGTDSSTQIRLPSELGRRSHNIASTSPMSTPTASLRTLGVIEQRLIDPSYSPQTNSRSDGSDDLKEAFMWMIAYNLVS